MKIILSRKGFDSASGGYPSPILPDNRLISLPIPNPIDSDAYSDLRFDSYELKNNGLRGEINTYCDLMNELGIKYIKYKEKRGEKPEPHKLETETKCHLDPDIRKEVLDDRRKDRMPIFGQSEIAQYHLDNKGVREGDLFLFFGRFQKTQIDKKDGRLRFDKNEPHLHIIFGYLHIKEKILLETATEAQKEWMKYQIHPHIKYKDYKQNTIFIASESFSLNGSTFPGYGVLDFSEDGVLTNRRLTKPSCSKWYLPECFWKRKIKISYHDKTSYKEKEHFFQSASRGQEFVIDADDDYDVKEWAKTIIRAGRTHKP